MDRLVALDSRTHRRLRVAPERVVAQSARLHMVPVVLSEFRKLCVHYPIVLTKNADTGRFVCVCLFGFEKHENLFWRDDRWEARYTPLHIARQPFFVDANRGDGQSVVYVDTANDSLQENAGECLFDEQGNETPYLHQAKTILATLLAGEQETQRFMEKLLALQLVQPMRLEIEFCTGRSQRVEGLYTVDEECMNSLSSAALLELHNLRYLAPVYTMISSLGQVHSLVERKNARLGGGV